MCSGISLFWRSRSLAIGLTSFSTKSRTERRISSCSSVVIGMRASLLRRSLSNKDRALVLEHLLAGLVESGGAKLDDAAIGPRSIALGQHLGLRGQCVAGIDGREELHLLVAEMRDGALAQVLDRQPEHDIHHQHVIDDDIPKTHRLRILAIEVD